jgi:uncharacterized protein (DUF433 family)
LVRETRQNADSRKKAFATDVSSWKGRFTMSAKEKVVHRTEYPYIVKVEGVCGGEAIIEGTRIAVWHIVGYYYKVGMSVEDILADWNYLAPAQVFSALAYYHDHKEEIDRVREENSYERWQQEQLAYAAA